MGQKESGREGQADNITKAKFRTISREYGTLGILLIPFLKKKIFLKTRKEN